MSVTFLQAVFHILLAVKLTSMGVQFISGLPADLSWGDVLLSIQCVHHIQLLVFNQFGNNFNAVPL